jgi:tight adherence protein B
MSSLPVVVAFFVGVIVYVVGVLLAHKLLPSDSTNFTRKQLKDLEQGKGIDDVSELENDLMQDRYQSTGILSQIYYAMPLGKFSHKYLVRGGMAASVDRFFVTCLGVFFVSLAILPLLNISKNGVVILLFAIIATYVIIWQIIQSRIKSRIRSFINQFPDALDIIVRSVRSGFPLNAAVNMVAESMQAPASEEFRKMSTEVVHGSTLVDALGRLGKRMHTPDINFFVVVLTLQQEVGGSLAEVLGNLSALIRKRKMMVKKIYAITSEGRFTGWVLGSLPLLVALAIHIVDPNYLLPLFVTSTGHVILGITVTTIGVGVIIIRKMVDMEI